MRIGKLRIALLLILCLIGAVLVARRMRIAPFQAAQVPQSSPNSKAKPDFALLPESEIDTFNKHYRGELLSSTGSWEPTVDDMNGAEANLPQISALSGKLPDASRHIADPRQYFRQYLAIVRDGKKMIFVNAFCSSYGDEAATHWRKRLVFVCDGGKCFWHALYDPSTQTFSNLTVNGYA